MSDIESALGCLEQISRFYIDDKFFGFLPTPDYIIKQSDFNDFLINSKLTSK